MEIHAVAAMAERERTRGRGRARFVTTAAVAMSASIGRAAGHEFAAALASPRAAHAPARRRGVTPAHTRANATTTRSVVSAAGRAYVARGRGARHARRGTREPG